MGVDGRRECAGTWTLIKLLEFIGQMLKHRWWWWCLFFTYSPFDHIPAVDASVHMLCIRRQFVSWRNIEEDQMMHLPSCLPSIANPCIYKSHAGLLTCWGALLLKAGGLIVAVSAVVAVGRFPNTIVSLCYLCTLVLYRSGPSDDFLIIVTSFVWDGLRRNEEAFFSPLPLMFWRVVKPQPPFYSFTFFPHPAE